MADLLHPKQDAEPETQETPFDPGDFVLAFTAENQTEAELLVAACEEADIPAILQSPWSGPVGTRLAGDGFNIHVPKRDLQKALKVLEERKAALDADPEGAARAAEAEEAETEKKG
ncbi:MAG TPA: hypothetical protein VLW85_13945 [Myxococcales bacterium]|nr:hypothetical protein [Myxococcales bacterium]